MALDTTKYKQIGVTFDRDYADMIALMAKAENRTVSNFCKTIIMFYVEEHKSEYAAQIEALKTE